MARECDLGSARRGNAAMTLTTGFVALLMLVAPATACEIDLGAARGGGWWACRAPPSADADAVEHAGIALSSAGYNFTKHQCIPSTVPGTAFVALLANGTFPNVTDPFHDDDLSLVPDINATGRD